MNGPGVKRDLFNCARVACGGNVIQAEAGGIATPAGAGGAAGGAHQLNDEPRPTDRIDWVLAPGPNQPNRGSALKSIASALRIVSATPIEASSDPYELLAHRVPIRTMIARNKIGLQHCCKEGVTLTDFLRSGYKLADLVEFRDVSGKEGKERALQALALGLRASANHFRDYPNAFPVEGVRKLTSMDNNAICEYFGLSFPGPHEPLQCDGDERWNAADVLKLGLNIDNLVDFGLQTGGQYAELVKGLSEATLAETERRLGVAQRHRAAWAKADAAIQAAAREEAERFLQHQQQQRQPVEPVFLAVPDEPVPEPVRAQPQAPIHHVPPRAAPAIRSGTTSAASPTTLTYEERARQRAQMHGFKG